jgi:hypothetical protein
VAAATYLFADERSKVMTDFVARLRTAAEKRVQFNSIYRELRSMPRETAIDLGMFPEDAYRIAHEAVYGR